MTRITKIIDEAIQVDPFIAKLRSKIIKGLKTGSVGVDLYRPDEEEEEDDVITIHPADWDEYYEDEEIEHTLSFDEDDQYYEERLEFHLTSYFNNN